MIHHLKESIELPIPISEAWTFFTDPNNLAVITPPQLDFKITSEPCTQTYAGQIITYVVRPLFGIPLQWVTEITHLQHEKYFVDEQRLGPYKMWHHQHRFTPSRDGTLVEDVVSYAMPFGIFGEILHLALVKRQLRDIFHYRKQVLVKLFCKTRN